MNYDPLALTDYVSKNKARRELFLHLVKIVRESGSDTMELPTDGTNIPSGFSRKQVIDFLRTLDKEFHAGSFMIGRKGSKTRFTWDRNVNLSQIEQALGGAPASGTAPVAVHTDPPSGQLTHQFILRPNCVVSLSLPADFSTAEAERVCLMIRALPMQ